MAAMGTNHKAAPLSANCSETPKDYQIRKGNVGIENTICDTMASSKHLFCSLIFWFLYGQGTNLDPEPPVGNLRPGCLRQSNLGLLESRLLGGERKPVTVSNSSHTWG